VLSDSSPNLYFQFDVVTYFTNRTFMTILRLAYYRFGNESDVSHFAEIQAQQDVLCDVTQLPISESSNQAFEA
jgi:hypothetical protein